MKEPPEGPVAGQAAELALLGGRDVLPGGVELAERCLACLDLLGQADLVIFGEEGVLPDIGQIQPDEVLFVALDAIFRH